MKLSYNLKRGDSVRLFWDGKLCRETTGVVTKATQYYYLISYMPLYSCYEDEIKVKKVKHKTGLKSKPIVHKIFGYSRNAEGERGAYYSVCRIKKPRK
jgi:hypothetical protein